MATRTWRGTLNSNYSNMANWAELAVPTNADAVVFDASSPNCTVDVTSVAGTLTCTNFIHTLTFTANLTVSGSITLGTGMSFSGSGVLGINASGTLTSNGVTCPQPLSVLSGAGTVTFSGTWTNTGLVTLGSGGNNGLSNGTLVCNGGLNVGTGGIISGTTNININATGTIQSTGGGQLRPPLTIAAGAGTVTFSGTFFYNGGTLTYTSGTVITSGATISIVASTTFNTSGMTWNAIIVTASITLTLNSVLNVTTFTLPNTNITFAGTGGFSIGTLTNTLYTATRTITYVNGVTYTITGSYTTVGVTPTIRQTIQSASAGNKFILTLQSGATQFIGFTDITDGDSSQGQQIFSYSGVITNTLNWRNSVNTIAQIYLQ